jgi:hypothetical protein
MAANPSDDNKPLHAMTGDEARAHALLHGFVLDDWSVSIDPFQKRDAEREFPWEDVEASQRDRQLQKKHRVSERLAGGLATFFAEARACPKCQASPEALTWFYFSSPKETWAMECGVEGWMAVCEGCRVQANFFIEGSS